MYRVSFFLPQVKEGDVLPLGPAGVRGHQRCPQPAGIPLGPRSSPPLPPPRPSPGWCGGESGPRSHIPDVSIDKYNAGSYIYKECWMQGYYAVVHYIDIPFLVMS